jgi:hypothetical protein
MSWLWFRSGRQRYMLPVVLGMFCTSLNSTLDYEASFLTVLSSPTLPALFSFSPSLLVVSHGRRFRRSSHLRRQVGLFDDLHRNDHAHPPICPSFRLPPSILSLLLTLHTLPPLQPCLFLAQDYMLLHHLADALGPDVAKSCLFIRSTWITKLFVASDVFTFLLQAGGGGMSAGSADMAKMGQKVR